VPSVNYKVGVLLVKGKGGNISCTLWLSKISGPPPKTHCSWRQGRARGLLGRRVSHAAKDVVIVAQQVHHEPLACFVPHQVCACPVGGHRLQVMREGFKSGRLEPQGDVSDGVRHSPRNIAAHIVLRGACGYIQDVGD
jgi:hypothetical protein